MRINVHPSSSPASISRRANSSERKTRSILDTLRDVHDAHCGQHNTASDNDHQDQEDNVGLLLEFLQQARQHKLSEERC